MTATSNRRGVPAIGLAVAALAFSFGLPISAEADIGIGRAEGPGLSVECFGGRTLIQSHNGPSASYAVPAGGGVVVAWSYEAFVLDETLKLKVFRPTADSATFTVVGESEFRDLPAPGIQRFPTRIPVEAGDRIGLTIAPEPSSLFGCILSTGDPTDIHRSAAGDPPVGSAFETTSATQAGTLNIAARVEPDADGDGYGDETQDGCPADASAQGPCPITLDLDAKRKQAVKRLTVRVGCGNAACKAKLSGKVVAKKKGGKRASAARKRGKKTFRVKRETFSIPAGKRKTKPVTFKNKKSVQRLRRLLKRKAYRKGTKAKLKVAATDTADNKARERATVKLRR